MRTTRSFFAALLGSLGALAISSSVLIASPALAVAESAMPTDTAMVAVPSGQPEVTSVALKPYLEGQPDWPSTMLSTFALLIEFASTAPAPGESVTIALSPGLTVATVPGTVTDETGRALATFEALAGGSEVKITFTEAAGEVSDLSATLAIFANASWLDPDGTTFVAEATIGDTVFPLSINYAVETRFPQRTEENWFMSEAGVPQFSSLSLFDGQPDDAELGGQWIASGPYESFGAALLPAAGSTRLFELDPTQPVEYRDPTTALVPGDDYTLNEHDTYLGQGVISATIPQPKAGGYAIEQSFTLVDPGAAAMEIPNTLLPAAARSLYLPAIARWIAAADTVGVLGSGIQGSISYPYFVSSGGTATASPAEAALSVVREIESSASAGETHGTVTITIENTGNVPLRTELLDSLAAAGARVKLSAASTERAVARAAHTPSNEMRWSGLVRAGDEVTVSYEFTAEATSQQAGSVAFSGIASGTSTANTLVSADAEFDDEVVSVSGTPDTDSATPATSNEKTLANTGADSTSLLAFATLVALMLGITVFVFGRTRRNS